ncbi:MAG: CHAD domain-containing protein [Lentisphaerae bacterium]|nr:CHAD domain-containing protein [Lentisphaerota bacterium]
MPAGRSIESLCRRYHNEDVHTEHVTRLALVLFDAVAPEVGLDADVRHVLEKAARLHDIGYAQAPGDHVRHGAAIIRRHGVAGLSRSDVPLAVGVMLLHSARWEELCREVLKSRTMPRPVLLKLGALLRVADALDHGHLQNAEIVDVRRRRPGTVLRVRAPGFEGVATRAQAKADLWARAMGEPMTVRLVPSPKAKAPYGHLLGPSMSAPEAARKLLFYYYRSITSHAKLAMVERDAIHLHDIRVGIRRFRSVLRLFRAVLAPTSAEYINDHLRDLCQRLGPLRDADVWMELLASPRVRQSLAHDRRWKPYLQRHQKLAEANLRRLRAILTSSTYRETAMRMAVLVRVEIPELMRRGEHRKARRAVSRKLESVVRRIAEQGVFRKNLNPETMHDLRILCRRGRYWTEFGAPLIGPAVTELARRLRAMADALGHLHDLDVAIESLLDDAECPRPLRGLLRADRRTALREAAAAWSKLRKPKLLSQALRELA